MLVRSNSYKNTMPQPSTALVKHRNQIMQRTRRIFSGSSSKASSRKLSTAVNPTTSKTNRLFKPQSQQANYFNRRFQEDLRPQSPLRPFSSESSNCNRAQSPLSIVRTRSKILSNQLNQAQSNTLQKSKYLRRGSAVDKKIINNVLKSKFNQNVCNPAFSYCDHEQNKELVNIIASQIPRGIKDVVGVEEMLRMSHIFTGTQFKNSNLTKKIKETLQEAKVHCQHGDQEDNLTLKSIKRW